MSNHNRANGQYDVNDQSSNQNHSSQPLNVTLPFNEVLQLKKSKSLLNDLSNTHILIDDNNNKINKIKKKLNNYNKKLNILQERNERLLSRQFQIIQQVTNNENNNDHN
ncbi:hypothetical protein KGF54_003478 [Candida jiufengensis]|uniref:uncharacterized protein n=1 Tax=Candida jiufengensis TaxID=497108 RepID=UPI0022254688|nr:uncharacterized protein KGF54_003478 [Candida jiufengensis]KAI5952611.1 hypothetical protein KGF54_003478 [Candida jiufengensis]